MHLKYQKQTIYAGRVAPVIVKLLYYYYEDIKQHFNVRGSSNVVCIISIAVK